MKRNPVHIRRPHLSALAELGREMESLKASHATRSVVENLAEAVADEPGDS